MLHAFVEKAVIIMKIRGTSVMDTKFANRHAARPSSPRLASRHGLDQYLAELRRVPLLTPVEERRQFRELRHGSPAAQAAARETIIQANLRLVVKVALAYRDFGVPLGDLVSDGNLGLLKALDRFDSRRGVRFATYAIWWIRQEVRRALDRQLGPVRLPTHLRERLRRYRGLQSQMGRVPDESKIMSACRLGRHAAAELQRAGRFHEVSLQETVAEGSDRSLAETLPDSSLAPDQLAIEAETRRLVGRLLRDLDERARMVLRLRFGLASEPVSLERIAGLVGLSRERVRQIQQESLAQLQAQFCVPCVNAGALRQPAA